MRTLGFAIAALALLAGSVEAMAETVYYSQPGKSGIQSVTGTILEETKKTVEIETEDGSVVSIPRSDVFQIIRGKGKSPSAVEFHPHDSRPSGASRLGLKGGMAISNIAVDPAELEDGDSLTGFSVGAWWSIPVNRSFSIQPEALYSVKGDAETSGDFTTSTRLRYIDVPVLARVGFLHGQAAQPSLFLGPMVGINLSATSKVEGPGGGVAVDVKDQVRAFDVGLVIGGGIDIPFGGNTFGVDLRYARGVSNMAGSNANGTGHNNALSVMGSVGFF